MSKLRQGLKVIDLGTYDLDKDRYELHIDDHLAPLCPYGNMRKFIGFDKKSKEYVWFTKSILLKLLK